MVCTNGGNLELASLLLLLDVELHYAALFIEEPEVLFVLTANVVNQLVVEGDEDALEPDLLDCIVHRLLRLPGHCDLALVSASR